MKLPDFTNDLKLIGLRRAMGAEAPGAFSTKFRPQQLSGDELDKLATGGIDVSFEEITELNDGTLAYKNSRVLVYIRDVSFYGGKPELPRFHVASCRTLREMKEKNRFGKYVIATRDDGTFEINKIVHGRPSGIGLKQLTICQNCLDHLIFEGFSYNIPRPKRRSIVSAFTIAKFFEKYPKSLHTYTPEHDSISAPINIYPPGFGETAAQYKADQNWICVGCDLDFSKQSERRFLHVHHENALKYDNKRENFRALCLGCHAEQPMHQHMKRGITYQEFLRLHGQRWSEAKQIKLKSPSKQQKSI